MEKFIGYAAAIIVAGGALWYFWAQHDAAKVQEGIVRQQQMDAAQANQDIATRRATDATFDRMDAIAVCRAFGREWVPDAGKSYCR